MADYKLTVSDSVIRTLDGTVIPADPANKDWAEYQRWLSKGGTPDAYVAPPDAPHTERK